MSAARSLLVAARMRTSTLRGRGGADHGRPRLSCSTRSSLTCMAGVVALISSRKMVPPSAVWKNPARVSLAPVNAPFT